jgi:hypothetical protein
VGLEDIEASDVVIPRISINHIDAEFKNNLTGQTFTSLRVVILGLVKQRIFWSGEEYEENDKPLCKSTDAKIGFPQMREDIPADKQFPWADSNFNKPDYPPRAEFNDLIALPCDKCIFAEWGKDPKSGKSTPPPCNEQYTYPLLYEDEQGELVPALFTTQKTGIKTSKQYNSYFASSRTAFFTVWTEITLEPQSRGTVRWAVPKFKRGDQTPRDEWPIWGDQARQIREFIRQPPRNNDADPSSDAVSTSDNVNTAPPAAAAPPAAPAPAAAAPPAAPQPAAPVQPATPVTPSAPVAPATPAAPAAPVAPDAEPVPAAPPATPEGAPSGSAPVADDDDIPF